MTPAIEQAWDELAMAYDTGGHWHGGPDPCPVCGGMEPPGRQTRASKLADLQTRLEERRRKLDKGQR